MMANEDDEQAIHEEELSMAKPDHCVDEPETDTHRRALESVRCGECGGRAPEEHRANGWVRYRCQHCHAINARECE